MTPVLALGGTGFLRSVNWRRLPGIVRAVREMRAYLAGSALADMPAEREDRIRAFFTETYQAVTGDTMNPELLHLVVDDMTRRVLSELGCGPTAAVQEGTD